MIGYYIVPVYPWDQFKPLDPAYMTQLHLMTTAGVKIKALSRFHNTRVNWRSTGIQSTDRFLLKVETLDQNVLDYMGSRPDVIEITKARVLSRLPALNALGVDVTGLNQSSTMEEIERRLVQYFDGGVRTFSEAM